MVIATVVLALSFGMSFYLVLAGLIGIFVVGVPLVLLAAAMWETNRVPALSPAPPEWQGKLTGKHQAILTEAVTRLGFTALGMYQDADTGLSKGYLSLLLSADRNVLLWMQHHKTGGWIKLITRYAAGGAGERWLMTCDILGMRDMSGLNEEMMVPRVAFAELLQRHLDRVADRGETPIPFEAATVVEDVVRHERERMQIMIERGLLRYVDAERSMCKHTFKGAMGILGGYFSTLKSTVNEDHLRKPAKVSTG